MNEKDASKIKEVLAIEGIILSKDEENEDEKNIIFIPNLDKSGIVLSIPVYELLAYLERLKIINIKRKNEMIA